MKVPQRPEKIERVKKGIECYACHEKGHYSQNWPTKREHLTEDRPGREHYPPRTALASNVSSVFVLKLPWSSKTTSAGEISGPSILVKADIVGAERRAVVETGGWENLMFKEKAEQYPVPLQKYDGTVYHAEGKQIRLPSTKTVPFCVGGRFVCDVDFLVAPMLPVDVIVGTASFRLIYAWLISSQVDYSVVQLNRMLWHLIVYSRPKWLPTISTTGQEVWVASK